MSVIGLGFLLLLFLWWFSPLRALFPYLFMPFLLLILAGAFLFIGTVSSTSF